jgi:hypothetical protein
MNACGRVKGQHACMHRWNQREAGQLEDEDEEAMLLWRAVRRRGGRGRKMIMTTTTTVNFISRWD